MVQLIEILLVCAFWGSHVKPPSFPQYGGIPQFFCQAAEDDNRTTTTALRALADEKACCHQCEPRGSPDFEIVRHLRWIWV